MRVVKFSALVAFATLFGSPGWASDIPDTAQTRLAGSAPWQVEFAEWKCVLSREFANNETKAAFSFTTEPLTQTTWLRIGISGEAGRRSSGKAVVMIDGNRVPGDVHYNIFDTERFRVREFMLDLDEHRILEARDHVRFWTDKAGDIEIAEADFASVRPVLNQCMAELYENFGISDEVRAQVAVEPEGQIFHSIDLPRDASRLDFALLFWVGVDGRVDDCRLLEPSGHKKFDTSLCRDLLAKGRFQPARNSAGQPVRAPRFENVRLRSALIMRPG